MPWPSSAVNSGPRRLSQAHGITETCRNSQPTCSAAPCSSPADRPDVQSQAQGSARRWEPGSKPGKDGGLTLGENAVVSPRTQGDHAASIIRVQQTSGLLASNKRPNASKEGTARSIT